MVKPFRFVMCTLGKHIRRHVYPGNQGTPYSHILSSEIKSNEKSIGLCFDLMSFDALALIKQCKIFIEFSYSLSYV